MKLNMAWLYKTTEFGMSLQRHTACVHKVNGNGMELLNFEINENIDDINKQLASLVLRGTILVVVSAGVVIARKGCKLFLIIWSSKRRILHYLSTTG